MGWNFLKEDLIWPFQVRIGYTFRHFLTSTYGQRQVRVIFEDDNHWVWVGTSEGVYVFQPDKLIERSVCIL